MARLVQACQDRAERVHRGQGATHADGQERQEPVVRVDVCLDSVYRWPEQVVTAPALPHAALLPVRAAECRGCRAQRQVWAGAGRASEDHVGDTVRNRA